MSLSEEAEFTCPYCMAVNSIAIDTVNDIDQQQIMDCQICCQPMEIIITRSGHAYEVIARTDDE